MGEVRGQGHDWTQGRRPVPRLHQAASRAPTSRGRAASLEVAAHSGGFSGLGTSLRRCSSMHTHPPAARTACTQPGESWTKVASTVAGQARVCGIRDHRCWRGYGAGLSGELDLGPWSRSTHKAVHHPLGQVLLLPTHAAVGQVLLLIAAAGSAATLCMLDHRRRRNRWSRRAASSMSGLQRSPAPVTGEPRRS